MQAMSIAEIQQRINWRLLKEDDYDKGFCDVLRQLTTCETSKDKFQEVYRDMLQLYDTYTILVGEDTETGRIVVSGSLILEKKFVHNGSSVGHIEDIVVTESFRGKHVGKELIRRLTKMAKEKNCYKVILNCSEKNKAFYEKCGYSPREVEMVVYFD